MKDASHNRNELDRRCAGFRQACRDRGIRMTPQRLAVYRALASDASHPTAESLSARLLDRVPGLSQATVYRTLEFLEAENLIRRVSGPESVGRFDAKLEHHQHLVCRVCGSLSDVSLAEFTGPRLPHVPGFAVEELDIRLVGRCRKCIGPSAERSGRRPADSTASRRHGRISSTR